jgi:hypothetical protein
MKLIKQIDLVPEKTDNGLWLIREEQVLGPDRTELLDEYYFLTERDADAFVDRWLKTNA